MDRAMNPGRNYIKIAIGALLILGSVVNLPLILKSSMNNQSSTAMVLTVLGFIGGLYLLYIGLHPRNRP
jgi:threonine/homoserine/homoserine lactone efflux protein